MPRAVDFFPVLAVVADGGKITHMKTSVSFLIATLVLFGGICFAESMNEEKAVIGGGCFWCVEAVFQGQPGIKSVESGYAAGKNANPTYKEVCTGETGHAEVVEIAFDPAEISYEKILELFWDAHDPTTLNRQGADEGTQYRSIIIAQNPAQRVAAEKSKAVAQSKFRNPIVTEIVDFTEFFPAEEYHQDFSARNPAHPYVRAVIEPKLRKIQNK
ncbi:MAG: peptide-methionine (S)-S-oxide reductase MsrA [Terrimicrobiaceae bacterium]